MTFGKDSMYVFKQCERCLKQVSDDSIHTCTPTELVRNLEAELSATKEKLEAANKDTATVLRSLRYCIGIAERGVGRDLRDDETAEAFLLDYVKSLEKRIRESQEQEPVAEIGWAGSIHRWLNTKLAGGTKLYTMPPIPPELAELQIKLETAESLINKFEHCIQQVSAELGNPACGGVDADDADSTTSVLVRDIRKITVENSELRKQLEESKRSNPYLTDVDGLHIRMDYKLGNSVHSIRHIISDTELLMVIDDNDAVAATCRLMFVTLNQPPENMVDDSMPIAKP